VVGAALILLALYYLAVRANETSVSDFASNFAAKQLTENHLDGYRVYHVEVPWSWVLSSVVVVLKKNDTDDLLP
jgi:hypothetical protein